MPGLVKVKLNDCPGDRVPESKTLLWSAVTVCVTASSLTQVTFVPVLIDNAPGVKEKFFILTIILVGLFEVDTEGVGDVSVAGPPDLLFEAR